MFELFKKKMINVFTPCNGKLIELENVNDEVFSSLAMGKGCAVLPSDGKFVAPITGIVTVIAPTKHAFGITGDNGVEVLVHIGLDSYGASEQCFDYLVEVGQHVSQGEGIVNVELSLMKDRGIDTTTPVIILNSDTYNSIESVKEEEVTLHSVMIKIS